MKHLLKMAQTNILIGTPAYNGMIHIDYFNSILGFHSSGINFSVMTIGNESLITRGRNTIISYFYDHPEFTHLLFIDADIGMTADSIKKLLCSEKDVIGAAVPLKGFDAQGNKVYNVGKKIADDFIFNEVDKVGTAVFMLSRKAVADLINNSPKYQSNRLTRGIDNPPSHYDVFQVGVVDGHYLSEDYWVCMKLKELGYKIYIDPTIQVTHNGVYQF